VNTASALPRLLACPSSAALPKAETASEWADSGQRDHADLARQTLTNDLPTALERFVPPRPRVEVKLAYDVATRVGRIIGEGEGRDYGTPGPFEIVGSCDVIGIDGDRVVVVDWKTGFRDVEPAATNAQLWFYALAACRALGLDAAVVRIVYTQTGRCDEYEIDALELAEFAGKLEALHGEIAKRQRLYADGKPLDTREGSWCRYCASKHACPSKTAMLAKFADVKQGELVTLGVAVLTPERARAGYEQLVMVEQLVDAARKNLQRYVDDNGPIDLGGGKAYGRYTRPGNRKLDGNKAVEAIAAVVGESAQEFIAMAVERKTSKSAIEAAAKALGCKRGTAPAVIRKLDELGGVTQSDDTYPYGEFSRDKNEPAPLELDLDAVNAALKEAS
jgi:CRISPR/Cas system-associated exonuclease Cas4 (RecB family)